MKNEKISNKTTLLLILFVIASLEFLSNMSFVFTRIVSDQLLIQNVEFTFLWILFETDKSTLKVFNSLAVICLLTAVDFMLRFLFEKEWKRFKS